MAVDPARAKSLFLAASDLTNPAERASYLDRECGNDAELRVRVEALLAANDASPLQPPENAALAPTLTSAGATGEPTADYPGKVEHAGAIIAGKYSLVEPIGEGGMGSVWRAKQTEPVKRFVAIKLIKAGMDSKRVLARFEAERQALALMDHPNIAKVLDGGLHDGRPYFVMELVKGVPITEYCDARTLTPKERLELFVPVCQAIQHAHQKGIIHRDIKPSNVLIALYDDRPVVKVIDFGVAKATGGALTEHSIDTGFGGVVGTPQYMSPEQATFNNLDIDTRSDVYALGVLLYELLTGSPPFTRKELEKKGLLEMLRVVREEEPPRPSTKLSTADALPTLSANRGTEPKKLTGLLRNELDWIVMKALEKDRTRRYETASGFAADVQRYLSGEAVQAHPTSTMYRLKKFVRRNRPQVIAVSLVLLTLMGGLIGTLWGLVRAERSAEQERLAKRRESERADGEQKAKEEAIRQKAAVERQIRETKAAESILLLGFRSSFHDWPCHRYEETPERPISVERLLGGVVDSLNHQLPHIYQDEPLVQAKARALVAWLLDGFDLLEPARQQYVAALSQYRRQSPELVTEQIASMEYSLSDILFRQAKYKEVEPLLREVVNWYRNVNGDNDFITRKTTNRLAETLIHVGKITQASEVAKQALEIGQTAYGNDDETTQESMEILGHAYSLQGKWVEADELFAKALELRRRINTPEYPPRLRAMEEFGIHLVRRGNALDAAALFRESLRIRQKFEPDAWSTFNTQSLLGGALLGQKRYAEAEPLLLMGYDGMKQRENSIPPQGLSRIPEALDRLIELYSASNKPDEVKKRQTERAKYHAVAPK